MTADADRNLLFGAIAVQMDFLSPDQLIAGMNAYTLAAILTGGPVRVGRGVGR